MRIEFDPTKDDINRAKHAISLQAATGFDWDTALEREEDRFVAVGLIESRLYVMVFTQGSDDNTVRILSLRPAEKHEMRFYNGYV